MLSSREYRLPGTGCTAPQAQGVGRKYYSLTPPEKAALRRRRTCRLTGKRDDRPYIGAQVGHAYIVVYSSVHSYTHVYTHVRLPTLRAAIRAKNLRVPMVNTHTHAGRWVLVGTLAL